MVRASSRPWLASAKIAKSAAQRRCRPSDTARLGILRRKRIVSFHRLPALVRQDELREKEAVEPARKIHRRAAI